MFDNTHSYLMWGFGAQRCVPGLNAEDTLSGEILRGLTLAGMANWDPGYRELVRMTDPSTLSLLPIRTSLLSAHGRPAASRSWATPSTA